MPRRQVIERQQRPAILGLWQFVDPSLRLGRGPINFTHDSPLDLTLGIHEQCRREDLDAKFLGPLTLGIRYQGQVNLVVLHEPLGAARGFFDIEGQHQHLVWVL